MNPEEPNRLNWRYTQFKCQRCGELFIGDAVDTDLNVRADYAQWVFLYKGKCFAHRCGKPDHTKPDGQPLGLGEFVGFSEPLRHWLPEWEKIEADANKYATKPNDTL